MYTSRWKLILAEYHGIRARLLNSSAILKDTNLVLFHINETTLTHWFKDTVQMEEIKPYFKVFKFLPHLLTKQVNHCLLPDCIRLPCQARVRNRTSSSSSSSSVPVTTADQEPTTQVNILRTTEWQKRKVEAEGRTPAKVDALATVLINLSGSLK